MASNLTSRNYQLLQTLKRATTLGVVVLALIVAACTPEPPPITNPGDPGGPGDPGPGDPTVPDYPVPTEWTFGIEFVGLDDIAPEYQAAFTDAADRWTELIAKSFDPVMVSPEVCPQVLPLAPDPTTPVLVDKIVIDVAVAPYDGPGNVLGYAGPQCVTKTTLFPVTGEMFFDLDDVDQLIANNQWADVIIHEMGHVLGLGTLWNIPNGRQLVSGTPPHYHGTHGMDAYARLGGMGAVPVQAHGGAGTQDAHWDETTFVNELMTGYINAGENPLSIISVASLMDLGYSTDPNKADPFTLPSLRLGYAHSVGQPHGSSSGVSFFSSALSSDDSHDHDGEFEVLRPVLTFIPG